MSTETIAQPMRIPATRGWWYRGQHHQNGFRQTVDELTTQLDNEFIPTGRTLWGRPECRRASDGEVWVQIESDVRIPRDWDPQADGFVVTWTPPDGPTNFPALVNS